MIKNTFVLLTFLLLALTLLHTYSEVSTIQGSDSCLPGACQCYYVSGTDYKENDTSYKIYIGEREIGACWCHYITKSPLLIAVFFLALLMFLLSLITYLRDRRRKFLLLSLAYLLFLIHYVMTSLLHVNYTSVNFAILWHLAFSITIVFITILLLVYSRKK